MVKEVRLVFDTPGGTLSGMDAARQALETLAAKKTVIAENHGSMESAGYYLATAAPKIQAMSVLARTGSIGVVMAGLDFTDAMAREGVKRIKIVSSNAPDKQPDPSTARGEQVLQAEVDAAERVFIRKVAESRGVTDQTVIEKFGKGGTFIARDPDSEKPDALKAGMIDSVITQKGEVILDDPEGNEQGVEADVNGGGLIAPETQNEGTIMDLNTLKAEHPALFQEAVSIGATQERERVDAHLTLGKASGDMDYTMACIADGAELTATVNAKHMAASMTKKAIADRATETEDDLETEETDAKGDETDKALAKATAEVLGVDYDA